MSHRKGGGATGAGVFFLCAALLVAAPAAATSPAEWPEFTAMRAAPDDPDAVYPFVNRAIDENRLTEAASALERLSRFLPDDAGVRLDLVEIYRALGADAQADALIAELRASPLTAAEAARLDEIAAPVRVGGFFAFGAGYDTNPAADPTEGAIVLGGQIFNGAADFGVDKQESPLIFYQGALTIDAERTADRPRLVFDLSTYGALFTADREENDMLVIGRGGPVFRDGPAELRPFAELGFRYYSDDPYSVDYLAGIEAQAPVGDGAVLTAVVAAGYRDHFDTDDAPRRDDMDGATGLLSLTLSGMATEEIYAEGSLRLAGVDARSGVERYVSFGADGFLSRGFDAGGRDVLLTLGGGGLVTLYDDPDPFFLGEGAREEYALFGFVSLSTPLDAATSIDGTVAYRARYSNIDLFENDGVRATLRIARTF